MAGQSLEAFAPDFESINFDQLTADLAQSAEGLSNAFSDALADEEGEVASDAKGFVDRVIENIKAEAAFQGNIARLRAAGADMTAAFFEGLGAEQGAETLAGLVNDPAQVARLEEAADQVGRDAAVNTTNSFKQALEEESFDTLNLPPIAVPAFLDFGPLPTFTGIREVGVPVTGGGTTVTNNFYDNSSADDRDDEDHPVVDEDQREPMIIGMGEVGRALSTYLRMEGRDVEPNGAKAATIHIAYPYQPGFAEQVTDHADEHEASLVVVHSTVPVGTCDPHGWVHSPVRGQHPISFEATTKTFGGALGFLAAAQWPGSVRVYPTARLTEAGKLFELAQYGLQVRSDAVRPRMVPDPEPRFCCGLFRVRGGLQPGLLQAGRGPVHPSHPRIHGLRGSAGTVSSLRWDCWIIR